MKRLRLLLLRLLAGDEFTVTARGRNGRFVKG